MYCSWCLLFTSDFPIGGKEYTKSSHSEDVDPNATRSLFVGNIPKNISIYELRDVFQRFGTVLVRLFLFFKCPF